MTYDQKFHNLHFDSIQALRGLAAVLVVMEHIRFLNFGAFGVDIFFCISGFMIMFTTHKNTDHFFLKRILRIVPFYYLMTIGTYLLLLVMPGLFEQTTASPVYLAKSLLFIPFDIGGGILQPLLRIGWTVNCEMFFYLLFGISLRISHRYRGLLCGLLLGLLVLSGRLFPSSFAPFTFYSDPIMLEFVMGMLCYEASRLIYCFLAGICDKNSILQQASTSGIPLFRNKKADHKATAAGVFCLLLALGLFCRLIITKHSVNILDGRRLLYWGFPAMIIVLAFFTAGLLLKIPAWSVRLGDISFSLYLVHYYPVLLLDRKFFNFSTFSIHSAIGAVLGIILVILLAQAAWYLIEKRFTGRLRAGLLKN